MMRVLCLYFYYAVPSSQDKKYSINLISKLNTPIMVLQNPNRNRANQIKVLQLN
jgi:hypothetical protein